MNEPNLRKSSKPIPPQSADDPVRIGGAAFLVLAAILVAIALILFFAAWYFGP